jgi:Protein of unknown function (DUF3703)
VSRTKRQPTEVRRAIGRELASASAADDSTTRWLALERAHILSQPWPWPHTVVHWRMLRLALAQRDRREAIGQVVRLLVAAPGSATGRYPAGNTGRAAVGLLHPMPVPDELATILAAAPQADTTDQRSPMPPTAAGGHQRSGSGPSSTNGRW